MPQPIRYDSIGFDLTKRFQVYKTVDASPALAAETVIATLNLTGFSDIAVVSGILLTGWATFTVGTSGVSAQLRIRQTDVNGSVIADSGATNLGAPAGKIESQDVEGFDSGAGKPAYALTLQIASGAAASTVASLLVKAIII